MKSFAFALASATIGAVLAQTTQTGSSLIPTGISNTCASFLVALDSAPDLTTCLSHLASATSAFDPNATTAPSADRVAAALSSVCSAGCSESVVRTHLANFYTACRTDLVDTKVASVITLYDVLYLLTPLRTAICTKNDAGQYCVQQLTLTTSTSQTAGKAVGGLDDANTIPVTSEQIEVAKSAWGPDADFYEGIFKRQTSQSVLPDTAAYQTSSLPYLFIKHDLPAAQLCTTCTTAVLAAYAKFESATPYALGLKNSPALGNQVEVWNGIKATCGDAWMTNVLVTAGLQSTTTDGAQNVGDGTSGAARTEVGSGVIVALAGIAAVVAAF